MQGKEIELNTNLNEEEKDVIDSIEKMESELKELVTKTKDLEIKRHDLICNNETAILKHDLEVMGKVYSLLGELKGTYDSDLQEVYDIEFRIISRLEYLQKELPEETFTEESIEA